MTETTAENAHIAMQQMLAKGYFDRDDLRIVGEHYPGTMHYAADLHEVTAEYFANHIRSNKVTFRRADAEWLAAKIGMPLSELNEAAQKPIKRSTGPYGWNTIMKNSEKYMTRIWLGRLRVHVFFKGDDDRDPHDHPWAFWTFPFTSYVEEVTEKYFPKGGAGHVELYRTRLQVVPAWRWNFRPAEHCHKVLGVFTGVYFAHKKDGAFVGIVDHPITQKSFETFARYGYTLIPQWEPLDGRRLITIVFRTGFQRTWGFLKSRDGKWCWQDFRAYLKDNGGNAPCE